MHTERTQYAHTQDTENTEQPQHRTNTISGHRTQHRTHTICTQYAHRTQTKQYAAHRTRHREQYTHITCTRQRTTSAQNNTLAHILFTYIVLILLFNRIYQKTL